MKLIDFGTATSYYIIDKKSEAESFIRMSTTIGTAYFMAPEVFGDNYNQSCDMWSIGVIMFILLGKYPPFDGESEKEIFEAIQKQELSFSDEIWTHVSDEGKDLISKLLVPEDERLSPKETLKHPWFTKT